MSQATSAQEMAAVLTQAVKGLVASRYVGVAGYTILIYDHLLTLPTEIHLVWQKPKGPVTFAFLWNRYVVPIVIAVGIFQMSGLGRDVSPKFCHAWLYIEGGSMIVSFGLAHYLASLRVRALLSARPWVDRTLLTAGFLYVVATCTITLMILVNVAKSFTWDPTFNVCNGTSVSYMHGPWIPGLLFESVLFGLIGVKAFRDWKKDLSFPITRLLYRDGVLYFGTMAGCSIFNILASAALHSTYILLAKYFCFALVTVMSSRIVLNLRTLRHGPAEPSSLTTEQGVELGAVSYGVPRTRRSGFPGGYLSAANREPALRSTRSTWSQTNPLSGWPLGDLKVAEPPASVAVTIQVDVHREVEVDEVTVDSMDGSSRREDEKKGSHV